MQFRAWRLQLGGCLGVAAKETEELIVGNFTNFEDETAAIADEAMDRIAETDEVSELALRA